MVSSTTFCDVIISVLTGLIMLGVSFSVSILFIVVGAIEDCDKKESEFLLVYGSIMACAIAVKILGNAQKSESDETDPPLYNLLGLVALCVACWGMSLVWPYHEERCSDLLYYTAFVAANMWWWIPAAAIAIAIIVFSVINE